MAHAREHLEELDESTNRGCSPPMAFQHGAIRAAAELARVARSSRGSSSMTRTGSASW
jgi:hypothetical protein